MIKYQTRRVNSFDGSKFLPFINCGKAISGDLFYAAIAEKTMGNKGMAMNHVEAIKDTVAEAIKAGKRIKIDGLGTIYPKIKKRADGSVYCEGVGITIDSNFRQELSLIECTEME